MVWRKSKGTIETSNFDTRPVLREETAAYRSAPLLELVTHASRPVLRPVFQLSMCVEIRAFRRQADVHDQFAHHARIGFDASLLSLSHSRPRPLSGDGALSTPVVVCPKRITVHLPRRMSHISLPSSHLRAEVRDCVKLDHISAGVPLLRDPRCRLVTPFTWMLSIGRRPLWNASTEMSR